MHLTNIFFLAVGLFGTHLAIKGPQVPGRHGQLSTFLNKLSTTLPHNLLINDKIALIFLTVYATSLCYLQSFCYRRPQSNLLLTGYFVQHCFFRWWCQRLMSCSFGKLPYDLRWCDSCLVDLSLRNVFPEVIRFIEEPGEERGSFKIKRLRVYYVRF